MQEADDSPFIVSEFLTCKEKRHTVVPWPFQLMSIE